mmetsp:Transcript_2886/g.7009  ORF Transcript_2886/g.7009 Transcript_2886/m.7009 type:complete len:320 (+) Transcript_2886:518-1477(+)
MSPMLSDEPLSLCSMGEVPIRSGMRKTWHVIALCALLLHAAGAADTEANGFRPVNLFVGIANKAKHIAEDVKGAWHAQAGQDRVVAAIFDNKQSGYFVDLAANHPIYLSNTRTLERDFGWQGLCIDGNAELLNELARHRTCTVVGSVVAAEKDSSITFRKFRAANWQTNRSAWEHGLSGIVSSGTDNKPSWRQWLFGQSKPSVDVDVVDEVAQATTLVNVLSSFGMPNSGIDYLSLDVEGAEWEVLRSFPFRTHTIRVITIERPSSRVRALLRSNNFTYARDIGVKLDELWLHGSMAHRLDASRAFSCKNLKCVRVKGD